MEDRYVSRRVAPSGIFIMVDRLSIDSNGESQASTCTWLVRHAFNRALALDTKLSIECLELQGMSGRNYRIFINNLIASMKKPSYLEVGSWMGSTVCAAIYGNAVSATCIDNWSEFDGPKDVFISNTNKFMSPVATMDLIEADFRKVDYAALSKHNVFLFDGPHHEQDQYDGLALALEALADEFVFIVDDWNFAHVRRGTMRAMLACNLQEIYSLEVRTTQDNTHAELCQRYSDWHNGYYIGVIRQKGIDRRVGSE